MHPAHHHHHSLADPNAALVGGWNCELGRGGSGGGGCCIQAMPPIVLCPVGSSGAFECCCFAYKFKLRACTRRYDERKPARLGPSQKPGQGCGEGRVAYIKFSCIMTTCIMRTCAVEFKRSSVRDLFFLLQAAMKGQRQDCAELTPLQRREK